jgi:hypothetical protein
MDEEIGTKNLIYKQNIAFHVTFLARQDGTMAECLVS